MFLPGSANNDNIKRGFMNILVLKGLYLAQAGTVTNGATLYNVCN